VLTRSYKVKDLFVVYYNGIKNQDNEISKLRGKITKNIHIANIFYLQITENYQLI
jgi:hypothetical protein